MQLTMASEDVVLWHRMVANVVNDGTAPQQQQIETRAFKVISTFYSRRTSEQLLAIMQ